MQLVQHLAVDQTLANQRPRQLGRRQFEDVDFYCYVQSTYKEVMKISLRIFKITLLTALVL